MCPSLFMLKVENICFNIQPLSLIPVLLANVSLTLIRISLVCGGATSISSITKGLLGSQATAALHLMI